LFLSLLAVAVGATIAVRRFIDLWRAGRELQRGLTDSVSALAAAAERTAERTERLGPATERLEQATARLRASRRQLSILLTAWSEARSTLGRAVFIPRK
jgi:ABC-type transporter Mla subunit MlaD